MCTDRRDFLRLSAGLAGAALFGDTVVNADKGSAYSEVPEAIRKLPSMTDDVLPISLDERRSRIEKARRLMKENGIDAIYIEPGSSMSYFTGMHWSTSERMFAVVIPARGEVSWVCPKFEEERARELIKVGDDIRTWEEDQSPYIRVAEILRDRGIRTGRIGMEERVRFFLFDGIRKEAPNLQFVSATPVTAGCRMFKSPA